MTSLCSKLFRLFLSAFLQQVDRKRQKSRHTWNLSGRIFQELLNGLLIILPIRLWSCCKHSRFHQWVVAVQSSGKLWFVQGSFATFCKTRFPVLFRIFNLLSDPKITFTLSFFVKRGDKKKGKRRNKKEKNREKQKKNGKRIRQTCICTGDFCGRARPAVYFKASCSVLPGVVLQFRSDGNV